MLIKLLSWIRFQFFPRHIKAGWQWEKQAKKYFPARYYEIIKDSIPFTLAEYSEDEKLPDYKIRAKNFVFWVEVKHSNYQPQPNTVYPFKPGQLSRYQSFENCFIFLHHRGSYYFIPAKKISLYWPYVYLSWLEQYRIEKTKPIMPLQIQKYIS